jgi:hypothetical protein
MVGLMRYELLQLGDGPDRTTGWTYRHIRDKNASMKHFQFTSLAAVTLLFTVLESFPLNAQLPTADLILTNGKIVTVDERFSIAQAVAIRGDRVVAVGTNQDIARLAGSATRRIDLRGRTMIPGLIDHHGHFMREGSTFQEEVRWDGVTTRKQALDMLRTKAGSEGAGAWLYTLMGWSLDQFTDDKRPFTREELDAVAPDHPIAVQEAYYRVYLNSRALRELGINDKPPDPAWMPAGQIVRDGNGRPTGVILDNGTRPFAAQILALPRPKEKIEGSHRAMIQALNRVGLTTVGSANCEGDGTVRSAGPSVMDMYRKWRDRGELTLRVFCMFGIPINTPQQIDQNLAKIADIKLFQGDEYLDDVAYGENVYGPANDNMLHVRPTATHEDYVEFGRLAREIAKAGLPLHVHTTLEATADGFLDQIERINKEFPIRNLRWAFYHSDQLTQAHLARMKRLGIYVGLHMRPVTLGGIFLKIRGDRGYDNPPIEWIQNSGIMWGIGTDFNLGPYNPFLSLHYLVTGKMVGGLVVNHQHISREDALIAHTRRNAFFVFQENNLGSIQPGKLADLVVLDRDYLTVPADQIDDIKPVLTMVGGKIVYDAAAGTSTP